MGARALLLPSLVEVEVTRSHEATHGRRPKRRDRSTAPARRPERDAARGRGERSGAAPGALAGLRPSPSASGAQEPRARRRRRRPRSRGRRARRRGRGARRRRRPRHRRRSDRWDDARRAMDVLVARVDTTRDEAARQAAIDAGGAARDARANDFCDAVPAAKTACRSRVGVLTSAARGRHVAAAARGARAAAPGRGRRRRRAAGGARRAALGRRAARGLRREGFKFPHSRHVPGTGGGAGGAAPPGWAEEGVGVLSAFRCRATTTRSRRCRRRRGRRTGTRARRSACSPRRPSATCASSPRTCPTTGASSATASRRYYGRGSSALGPRGGPGPGVGGGPQHVPRLRVAPRRADSGTRDLELGRGAVARPTRRSSSRAAFCGRLDPDAAPRFRRDVPNPETMNLDAARPDRVLAAASGLRPRAAGARLRSGRRRERPRAVGPALVVDLEVAPLNRCCYKITPLPHAYRANRTSGRPPFVARGTAPRREAPAHESARREDDVRVEHRPRGSCGPPRQKQGSHLALETPSGARRRQDVGPGRPSRPRRGRPPRAREGLPLRSQPRGPASPARRRKTGAPAASSASSGLASASPRLARGAAAARPRLACLEADRRVRAARLAASSSSRAVKNDAACHAKSWETCEVREAVGGRRAPAAKRGRQPLAQ